MLACYWTKLACAWRLHVSILSPEFLVIELVVLMSLSKIISAILLIVFSMCSNVNDDERIACKRDVILPHIIAPVNVPRMSLFELMCGP